MWREILREREVAAIGGIGVDAEIVAVAEIEDFGERVDGAGGGGAHGDDDGADVAFAARRFSSALRSMRRECVDGDRFEIEL